MTKIFNEIYTEERLLQCMWELPYSLDECVSVSLKSDVLSLVPSVHSLSQSTPHFQSVLVVLSAAK
jgi:hypothetical protein